MARRTRRLTVLGRYHITLVGQDISYTLKRSPRLRYVRIELRPQTGVTVVVPGSFDLRRIPSILKARQSWILSSLAKYSQPHSPLTVELKDGDTIPYLGQELKLEVRRNQKTVDIQRIQYRLMINLGSRDGNVAWLLEQWYRFHAERLLAKKVEDLSARLKLSYQRVTIRGQRTRWGSCSQHGNLSFNWKLMMTPEPVVDYVVIHELIHLKEMNHSKRFWELLAGHCPDWRRHKQWLKDNEARLNTGFPSKLKETA